MSLITERLHWSGEGYCALCGSFAHGNRFPSGNRNPVTRETPYDNFICDACQEEARVCVKWVQRVMDVSGVRNAA